MKKGLDRVLAAWARARRPGEELVVVSEHDIRAEGVRRVDVRGEAFRALVRRARVYVVAPRREDYGIAQLEALADGCMLVTTVAAGPYEALDLARAARPAARRRRRRRRAARRARRSACRATPRGPPSCSRRSRPRRSTAPSPRAAAAAARRPVAHVVRRRGAGVVALVGDGLARGQPSGITPAQTSERVVLLVVDRRAGAGLRRRLGRAHGENVRAFSSLRFGTRTSPQRPGTSFSVNASSAASCSFAPIDPAQVADDDGRAVVHRVVERRAREHQAVDERRGQAGRARRCSSVRTIRLAALPWT